MDENAPKKSRTGLLMSSGVIIAIITSSSSLVKAYWQGKNSNDDMQDSYKAVAQAVNTLQFQVGVMQGRLDEIERIHQQEARYDEGNKKHDGKVLRLGEVNIVGKVGSSTGGSVPPSAVAPTAPVSTDTAAMAITAAVVPPRTQPPAPTQPLPLNLEQVLVKERTGK
jgi:TolA-binding protein